MALNIRKWDDRIREDYQHIAGKFHKRWENNRDVMNNEGRGSRFGNLTKEYAGAVRSRLINKNFFVSVKTDDPNFAKDSQKMTIMANSLARTVDLKDVLDEATEHSLWSATGWLEVGHSLDLHSFDPMRSVLHKGNNSFNPAELRDEYVPVPREEVEVELGSDIGNVAPFDPFQVPEIGSAQDEPQLTFDPDMGSPWIKTVSPFSMVVPRETKNIEDADYITKLVVISKQELSLITDIEVPKGVEADRSNFERLIQETPGGKHIDHPIIVAVTFIRRDRNAPEYSGWYLAHVLGHPNIVIKDAPNPYGGMIPLIPAKSRASMKILAKSWVEDLRPYTDNYAKVLEAAFRRIRTGLTSKWSMGANGSVDERNRRRIDNPDYSGQVKFESGSTESFQYLEGPGLTQDILAGINLVSKIAQGETGQTDIDRGTPVKKITARQTEALLKTSEMMMEALRGPIVDAGNEAVLKLIHLLNLFSSPRTHVFQFGSEFVEVEPGGNDFTTSYQYRIEVKDLEGPANAEQQLLMIQFFDRVYPLFQDLFNRQELANEGRRAFGMGPEVMMPAQVPGIAGENPALGMGGGPMLQSVGRDEHPGRLLGDQGTPEGGSIPNALAGLGG